MRGAGKSTVGRELARLLRLPFVDSDAEIEMRAGRTIAEIFATGGEAEFRRLERETIQRLADGTPKIISVGGGAVLEETNVEFLRRGARVVWLRASVEVLWGRIDQDPTSPSRRPALTSMGGLGELRTLLAIREPIYRAAADMIVDTDGREPEAIACTVESWLNSSRRE